MEINPSHQLFSLKWNNYLSHIMDAFEVLRNEENLVDVTLSCEGYKIKAHKMLLSACSSYFKDLFKDNPCQHPIVVFRNVKYCDLRALIDFIYQGEVNIVQDQLPSFLATAKLLQVKGLTDNNFDEGAGNHESESYDDENVSENVDDEEMGEEETLSEVSQYAQSAYAHQEITSGPLTIIPIQKNMAESGGSGIVGGGGGMAAETASAAMMKRKLENDEEAYIRRQYMASSSSSTKQQQSSLKMPPLMEGTDAYMGKSTSFSHDMTPLSLSFKTKQSVEIFPVPPINSDKVDDSYPIDASMKEHARSDRLPECELQTINVEQKIKTDSLEDSFHKRQLDLSMNHMLSKSLQTAEGNVAQDSFQGHWLSSLNNEVDGSENAMNDSICVVGGGGGGSGPGCGNTVTITNRKGVDPNVDYSQGQRHRYTCTICGATYKHLRNLRAHCHLHYGKTRCNLCNKVLCNISYFKKHLQQQHGLLTAKKSDAKNLSTLSPSVAAMSTS